ncbi:hypothetical protein BJP65_00845 [Microbacterium sp. BH-3-3-3]|nr:hypothetical protein BJP65_00845 [Microbacterium sp. BH-3-3-3]
MVGAAAWGVPAMSLVTAAPAWAATSDATQVSLSVPNNQLPASGATPVVVTVRDHLGSPLAGQVVSLLGPDGSVFAAATGTTNGAGQFSTTIDLATPWMTPGKTVAVTAVSGGTSASASATVLGSNLLVGLSQTPRVFPSPVVDYSALWGLAVLADGSVWKNDPNWVVMPEITNATRLSASTSVYVLKKDGTVVGWGVNGDGQLGDGTTTDRTSPVVFQGLSNVTQIQAGNFGLHALKSDGTVWYQGRNLGGIGGVGLWNSPVPLTKVPLSARAVQVVNWVGWTAGVVLEDGTVWTWGINDEGQLGDGTSTQPNAPVKVLGLSGIIALAGSTTFQDYSGANYLALKNDGTVWSWGRNESGQLGYGGTTLSSVATQVPWAFKVAQIAMSPSGAYALTTDGVLLAWGRTGFSSVGTVSRPTIVSVSRPISTLIGNHGEAYPDGCALLTAETTTSVDVVETTLTAGVAGTVNAKVAAGSVGLSGAAVSLSATGNATLGAASGATGQNGVFSTSITAPQWSTPGTQVRVSATSSDGSASETVPVLGSNLMSDLAQTPRVFPSPVVDYSPLWGLAVLADGSVWKNGPNWVLMPEITNAARLSTSNGGPNSAYVLKKDGTIVGWGVNGDGQLGDGTTTDRTSPVVFQGLSNVTQIQAGLYGLHALKSDGTLWFQGQNTGGIAGVGLSTSPVPLTQVPLPARAVQVVNWAGFTGGAVLEDGTVWTWGYNEQGQLGDGTTHRRTSPSQVVGLSGIVALAGSSTSADYSGANWMALKNDGTVWSWGRNGSGQLGYGGTTNSSVATQVPGVSNVAQIAMAPSGAYALKKDGTFLAWGRTGLSSIGTVSTPTVVPVSRPIAKVVGIHGHSYGDGCPLITSETTTTVDVVEATLTAGVAGTVNAKVAAGSVGFAGAAVSLSATGGATFGAASGTTGQNGVFSTSVTASQWSTPGARLRVSANGGDSSASETVPVVGSNLLVGLAQTSPVFPSPVVDYSPQWGLAVLADGSVWRNGVVMPEITNAARVSTSTQLPNTAYVLKKDGTIVGWGENTDGQLGDGTTTTQSLPVVFQGLSGVTQIQAGQFGLHALKSDGTLWFQGRNTEGRGGVGSTTSPVALSQVVLPARAVQVVNWVGFSAGAVLEDGTVWTWGRNTEGQLADGTTTQRNTPVKVLGLSGITALAGSTVFGDYNGANYLALKNDGTVWSWGRNAAGQLGRNGTTNSFVATQIPGLTNVTQVAMTPSGAYALKSDGTFLAWGRTGFSSIGTVSTPTAVSVARPISRLLSIRSNSYADGCALLVSTI